MGKKIDPRDFLLNTDYEMDKIIYYKEFKYTVSRSSSFTTPHNLKTIPLVFGIWSYHPDYSDCHELGASIDFTNSPPCLCGADYTNITIELNPRNSNETFYIKVFAFETTYSNPDYYIAPKLNLPTTSKYAKNFVLNTDYNYLKLLKSGDFATYDSSVGYSKYSHNLGYVPQLLEWSFAGGQGIASEYNYHSPTAGFTRVRVPGYGYTSGIFVTDSMIECHDSLVLMRHEMRLYCDEA